MAVLIPDLVWHDGAFRAGLGVHFDGGSGRIVQVRPAEALVSAPGAVRLSRRALLPGFVNAHSHSFQRLIRGRTQWRPAAEPESDFWSWRQAMYRAALGLSPDDLEVVARFCFLEMVRAGITTVGEFHYLHRDPAGEPYADGNELARRVIEAARSVGMRIVLLDACYAAGGIGRAPSPEQRRFLTPDLDGYLAGLDALASAYAGDAHVSFGIAPHSVRAVPHPWLRPLRDRATERGWPLHMHVSEQPREVEECRAATGFRPVALLADLGVLSADFTAVHATHLEDDEVAALGAAGATVCACPTTERDLGDGILRAADLVGAGVPLALGSDSQTVIDMFQEMRLIEYHERLRRLRRVVLAAPDRERPDRLEVAPALIRMATAGGARSLGVDSGRIEAGALADFVAIDLDHPSLAGWDAGALPALLGLSAPAAVVTDVWIGGVRRVEDRRHDADPAVAAAFRSVAARLAS